MKRLVALFLALLLIGMAAAGLAEDGNRILTVNLDTATDEELADAVSQIRAEQRARLKTTIETEPAEVTVNKGVNAKVVPTVKDLPEGVTAGTFTWSSADETIATCKGGVIKGINGGKTIVTCATILSDGTEVFTEIPVTCLVPVQSITPETRQMDVMAGDVFMPVLIIKPDDASNKDVVITSADEKIVSVNAEGQLVAGLAGKTSVTITAADGSGKSVKMGVNVTKKIGKYDDELLFQGIEWGSDVTETYKKLADAGLVEPIREDGYFYSYVSCYGYMNFWPKDDLYFASSGQWQNLPVVFQDQRTGAGTMSITPLKKIGGYEPQSVSLCFTSRIGEDGQIVKDDYELCGVVISYDNKHERGADIFVDLLAKMEAQYGEFTRYLAKDLTGRYYKEIYDIIKGSMTGAKMYTGREFRKENIYLSDNAFCLLRGKNNTGIMLSVNSSEYVTIFYGKTDTLEKLEAIQKLLEAVPDDKEDAGL